MGDFLSPLHVVYYTRFKVIKQGCVLSCFVKCQKAFKINGLRISEQFLYFVWFHLFSFIWYKIWYKIVFKKPRPIIGNGSNITWYFPVFHFVLHSNFIDMIVDLHYNCYIWMPHDCLQNFHIHAGLCTSGAKCMS